MKLKDILPEMHAPAPFPSDLSQAEPLDSEQDSLDLGSRQVNVRGGKGMRNRGDNFKKARRVQAFAKRRAKEANSGGSQIPSGWRADPHQGSYSSNWRTQT